MSATNLFQTKYNFKLYEFFLLLSKFQSNSLLWHPRVNNDRTIFFHFSIFDKSEKSFKADNQKIKFKNKNILFPKFFINISGGSHIDEYKLIKLNIVFVTRVVNIHSQTKYNLKILPFFFWNVTYYRSSYTAEIVYSSKRYVKQEKFGSTVGIWEWHGANIWTTF